MSERIETLFRSYAAEHPRDAVALAIADADGDPRIHAAGPLRRNDGAPVQADALWHVGSITKSFTATLVLRLVEEGALDLDTPISTYLGNLATDMHPDWAALTLRQLLSHTGGVPVNGSFLSVFRPSPDGPSTAARVELRRLWTKPIDQPAEPYRYSNVGYVLAGLVTEAVTDRSWRGMIRDDLAGPLGLQSLGFGPPLGPSAPWGQRGFVGYRRAVDPEGRRADNPDWLDAAGRLHMSISDLVAWGQAHLAACAGAEDAILTQASCTLMRRPVAEEYGLGWVIQPLPEHEATIVWHNGSNTMWYAILAMIPEHDMVVAITQNSYDQPAVDGFLRDVVEALLEAG